MAIQLSSGLTLSATGIRLSVDQTIFTPVANFNAIPTSGTPPLTTTFTDTSTNSPTSWLWNFGDGNTSTQQNPVHVYSNAGTYTVSLTATNLAGSDTKTVNNLVTITSDPYWANVSLLISGDGNILDESQYNNTVNIAGGATTSTSQSKFGSSSIYLNGSSQWLSIPEFAGFDFGTGDYTIECWAMPIGFGPFPRVFSKGNLDTVTSIDMEINSENQARPRMPDSSYTNVTGINFTLNNWHFVTMSRSAGVSRFFIDGVQKLQQNNNGNATNAQPFYIGVHNFSLGPGTAFNGFINEFRVTKGVGRYTASFTPPTAPFPAA